MKRSLTILFFVLALALVQIACSLPSASSSGGSTSGTAIPVVVNTATVTPHPDPSPTNTHPLPTATTTVTAENASSTVHEDGACTHPLTRLQFQPGATSTIVTGDLGANETCGYLLAARQDQVIIAGTSLDDWQGGVRVKITTKDNVALPDLVDNIDVVASLPSTQDYIVWVSGGSFATSYHLAVTIPIRITFDPGAVSASVDGSISNGVAIWYVLRASAGQTLTASLDGSDAGLSIAGLENPQVLTASASDKLITSWTGTLPATQDYIIQVMHSVDSTTYTLHVAVQ